MEKQNELTKSQDLDKNSIIKNIKNPNEPNPKKRTAYMAGLFMAIVYKSFSFLESGKINEAIIFTIGSFFVFSMLFYLAQLFWDE